MTAASAFDSVPGVGIGSSGAAAPRGVGVCRSGGREAMIEEVEPGGRVCSENRSAAALGGRSGRNGTVRLTLTGAAAPARGATTARPGEPPRGPLAWWAASSASLAGTTRSANSAISIRDSRPTGVGTVMRRPSTFTPLALPSSVRMTRPASTVKRACRRDTAADASTRVRSGSRPMVIGSSVRIT